MSRHRWATSKRNTSRSPGIDTIAQLRFIDMNGRKSCEWTGRETPSRWCRPSSCKTGPTSPYTKEMPKLDRGQTYVSELELNAEQGVIEQPVKPTPASSECRCSTAPGPSAASSSSIISASAS
jgi:hypothetical protein